MAVDKVKPLGLENPASGGTQTDPFPTELDPNEDYIAAKGVAFENADNRLIDLDVSGNLQFKDFTETTYWPLWKMKYAAHHVFDPTGSPLISTTSEEAIKEIAGNVGTASRAFTFAQYNGNANTGRYLEFFSGIASSDAPIYTPEALKILTIVSRTTGTSATCTIGFYNSTALLYTLTHTAQKQVILIGTSALPIFTVPAMAELNIKIDSGSITKPHLYFVAQGG